jgi:hypothetical protein
MAVVVLDYRFHEDAEMGEREQIPLTRRRILSSHHGSSMQSAAQNLRLIIISIG